MFVFRYIPSWAVALFALALPVTVVYKLGANALPVLLALIGFMCAFLLQKTRYFSAVFVVFFVTFLFSVEMPLPGGAAIFAPAEPLVLLLALSTVFYAFRQRIFLRKINAQPLFWAVLLFAFALIFSTAFSTIFVVSIKYVFIVLALLSVGIFTLPLLLEAQHFSFVALMKWLAVPVFLFVVLAIVNLLPYRFNPGSAALIGQPFFKDHTVFSATFSLLVPLFVLWPSFQKEKNRLTFLMPVLGALVLFVLFVSSSRAAWISLLLATVFYGFVKLGGTLKQLISVLVFASVLLVVNLDYLEKKIPVNPYNSTDANNNLTSQALSVTNVNSDVSNLERINRWKSAIKMGEAKPLFGFGPGTYQFQYFPYQADADKTYISVDSPFNTIVGRGGSAHSEYLLLFSESGVLGLLSWVALQMALLYTFFKIWQGRLGRDEKNLSLAIYLGTLTFTLHSLFNNYLNSAQFGILWWSLVGALLFFAIKNKNKHVVAH